MASGEDAHERRRDHRAVRLWIQLEHRSVDVPLRAILDWPDPVRAEISDYVLALSTIELRAAELRAVTTMPAVLREYVSLDDRPGR